MMSELWLCPKIGPSNAPGLCRQLRFAALASQLPAHLLISPHMLHLSTSHHFLRQPNMWLRTRGRQPLCGQPTTYSPCLMHSTA